MPADDVPNHQIATVSRRHDGPISRRLLAIARTVRAEEPSVGELFDGLESEGLGLTLLLLTLPALIPLPGPFGMVFGTLVALVALQILFGAERLWLPETLRRRPVPQRLLRNVIRAGLDWASFAERGLREDRLVWLTGRRARMLLALPLLLMAVTIILPIPMGNVMPALALIAASIGFMACDGLAVLVSILIAMAAVVWTAVLLYTGAAAADYAAALLTRLAVSLRAMLESVGVDLGFAAGVATGFAIAAGITALVFWIQAVRHRRHRRIVVDPARALPRDGAPRSRPRGSREHRNRRCRDLHCHALHAHRLDLKFHLRQPCCGRAEKLSRTFSCETVQTARRVLAVDATTKNQLRAPGMPSPLITLLNCSCLFLLT